MPQLPDTELDALLASIREDPDNPAPWSVYADWLQSRGDPTGELIALQLERDRCSDRERRLELGTRIRGLGLADDLGLDAWLTVRDVLPSLVDEVRPTAIRRLSLFTTIGPVQLAIVLAAIPYMPLRALFVGDLAPAVLREILIACRWLRHLNVVGSTPAQAEVVARSARGLVQFGSGRSSTLGDAGLVALSAIATLRVLELERAEIGAAGIASLIRHIPVEKLVLTGNPLGHEGVAALCAATTLRELAIDETRFTSESIVAIADAPGLASLRRLRLGYERSTLAPGDLQTLVDSPYLSRELVLEIDGHALGLESEYRDRDYAPEFNGFYWASQPTGPIAERFHVEVCGLPTS